MKNNTVHDTIERSIHQDYDEDSPFADVALSVVTNGYQGGDGGHGGFSELCLTLKDPDTYGWEFSVQEDRGKATLVIHTAGDYELAHMIKSLRWFADELSTAAAILHDRRTRRG